MSSHIPGARTIATTIHGRYLVRGAPEPIAGLLVGFHGYGETADDQLARLTAVPGVDVWVCVAVQGLHRFYRGRAQEVVASWMTSQDRDLAIADNLAYVTAIVDTVRKEYQPAPVVFCGFSQGVAMAFRAACRAARPASGVIALGGDVPPELERAALGLVPSVLVGRGAGDELYTSAMFARDSARLRDAGCTVVARELPGGHQWPEAFSRAAGEFLRRL